MGNVHEASVVAIEPLARDVLRWRFRGNEPLTFRPGQFLSVRVGEDSSGAAILRSYSLASSPGSPEFDLVLKLVDGGAASDWFRRLRVGEQVRFTGPMGYFVLDFQHAGDVVFGATGVGITPVLPMLQELLARTETGQVQLYWGNRSAEDLFWIDELRALERIHPRLKVRWFLSGGEHEGLTVEKGRITPAILGELEAYRAPVFYLVGNGAMIRELKTGLVERGVDRKRQIRNEAFFE
jgi:ferredoxin-NADP reductase